MSVFAMPIPEPEEGLMIGDIHCGLAVSTWTEDPSEPHNNHYHMIGLRVWADDVCEKRRGVGTDGKVMLLGHFLQKLGLDAETCAAALEQVTPAARLPDRLPEPHKPVMEKS